MVFIVLEPETNTGLARMGYLYVE